MGLEESYLKKLFIPIYELVSNPDSTLYTLVSQKDLAIDRESQNPTDFSCCIKLPGYYWYNNITIKPYKNNKIDVLQIFSPNNKDIRIEDLENYCKTYWIIPNIR